MAARFGLFDFDSKTGTLTREGVPVRLQPQPARVLALLVDRAGDVVSRDELKSGVWGDATFVDFERGLNFCIAQIRTALGDSAESPRFIETLPRRGYRFIAPVRSAKKPEVQQEAEDRDQPLHSEPVVTGPSRARRVAVGAIVLLVAATAAVAVFGTRPSGAPVRVAVVPFDNETGSTEYDRIAGGVADATVARLAAPDRLARVAVIGNAAVLRRPRAFRDLKAIGQELDAEYVVLAQVKNVDGRVRLIAHLIRTDDQAHVWAHTFDPPSFGLDVQSALAEDIARSVVDKLVQR